MYVHLTEMYSDTFLAENNFAQCGPTRAACVIRSATLYPQNAPCFDPSKIGR